MDQRQRLTATLFGGAALGTTGHIAAVTVASLVVSDITGSATLAGLPGSVAIVGTAAGTSLLTLRVDTLGRRPSLIGGYTLGGLGALLGIVAVVTSSLPLFLAAMAAMGFGNAANQLSRYTGAEMYPAARRATALSVIVWAGTVGSVLGPTLLDPAGGLASDQGLPALAGGYGITAVFLLAAAALLALALRPDPATLADAPAVRRMPGSGIGDAFRRPGVRVALAAMIAGQVVMVLIMTATPLHVHHDGASLGIVGLVMSAHTFGMFAFSPLTGRLADRIGHRRTIGFGLGVLATSAVVAAAAPADSTPALVIALFLLGIGWNFGFVAGSALLTVGVPTEIRAALEGRADSVTWTSSAAASLISGAIFQMTDYRSLALASLALLIIPVVVLVRNGATQPALT